MKNNGLFISVFVSIGLLVAWTLVLRNNEEVRRRILPLDSHAASSDTEPDQHSEPSGKGQDAVFPATDSLIIPISTKMQATSGAKLGTIQRSQWNEDRIIPAKLELDPGRHYAVTAPADVVVEELLCPLGKAIQSGEPLVEFSSSQLTNLRGTLSRQQLLTEKARTSVKWHRDILNRVNDIIVKIESNMGKSALDKPSRDWLPPTSVQTAEYGAKIIAAYSKFWAASEIAQLSERVVNSGVMAEKSMIERATDKESARAMLRGAIEQSRFELQQAILSAESDLAAAEGALQSTQADMRRFLGLKKWDDSLAVKPHDPKSPDRFLHYSPGTGFVLERYFANGERATMGELVVLVADIRSLWCVGDLRQGDWDLMNLHSGDEIKAEIVGLESKGTIPAKVEMVGGMVQSATGSIHLTASISNEDLLFRPGMIARLILQRPSEAIVVPANAVFSNDGHDYLVKQESEETFRLVPIKIGKRNRHDVEVTDGVQIGWTILLDEVFPIASQAFLEKE